MQVRDNEAPEDYFYVSGLCFSMTPFFSRIERSADGLGLIWSRYAHARSPGSGRYLRHYQTKCPHVTRHMTA